MKKRMLALAMTLVMIFNCFGGITAFAVNATGHDCDHSTWTELTQSNIASNGYTSKGFFYLNEGSYYLGTDIALDVTVYIASDTTVDLCLNGYDISMNDGKDRTVLNLKSESTFNLYDCGTNLHYWDVNEEKIGVISADGASSYDFTTTGGAITGGIANAVGGGGVFIQDDAIFNMYGGNIVGNQCAADDDRQGGGVYNYCGTFNMYGGTIQGNASNKTIAGGVYNRVGSTFNMYGGTIAYNYSITYGGGVYNVGTFNISGTASINNNTAGLGGGGVSTTGIVNLFDNATISNNTGTYRCGGVFIASNGTLTMSGGSITGNTSGNGGEAGVGIVYDSSTLNMTGGTISGNTTTGASAGVGYTNGTFNISGDAVIEDNIVVDSNGDEIMESNAYISNGKVITVDEEFTGTVGVGTTLATGTGTVASGAWADVDTFTSDAGYYLVQVDDSITLQSAVDTDGADDSITYSASAYDVTQMFSAETSETEYSIIGGTGTGTISGSDLTVDKIGTFIVKADTPYSSANTPTVETATLTVTAKTVNISDITTTGNVTTHTADLENDGVDVTAHVAELNNTSGSLSGVVNDDDVSIDFTVAYGLISDEQGYDERTVEDEDEFDVTLHDISLTGDDAGNYVLGTVADTIVTINVATPYISWPTAKDITYGDDRSDSDLIGGQIMVKYGGTYFDITDKGSFVWATDEEDASYNVAIDAAGTHTYAVSFEFNDDITPSTGDDWDGEAYDQTAYAKYVAAAEAATHNVTQLVNAKEVTFTIENNVLSEGSSGTALSITPSDGLTVEDDYRIYFTDSAGNWVTSNWTESHTTPIEAGTYLIAADFTKNSSVTSNYIHAGTMDSTAKQIGAYVVYDGETVNQPTTYSVTFTDNSGYNITDAIEEEIHILPSLDTSPYSGWSYNGSTYEFGSRFPQPNSNVTFTAVPVSATATISGTISGNTMKGEAGELSGIVVALIQGPDQIAITTTDENGAYSFTVPQGRYDLVVTRDYIIRNEETIYVELDADGETVNVTLPDTRQNTIFNVASGMTAITVEGMKDLMTGEEIRSIKLEVNTATTADAAAILAEAAKEGLTTDNAKLFFDISIQERGEDAANYVEIPSLQDNDTDSDDTKYLTLYIPLAGIYQGYNKYVVYRDDGTTIDIFQNDAETGGEYMTVDGDLLTLHIQTSGIYGLAFYFNDATELSATDIEMEYTAAAISTDTMFANILGEGTPTYVITSDDGEATIDSNGNVTIIEVGTFTITARVSDSASKSGYISEGTLTVTQKEVTISGVTCVDCDVSDVVDATVDINDGGRISGVEGDDVVYINFTSGSATITDSNFAQDTTLTTTGENSFDTTVTGLALTGADAMNYTLVGDVTSQVTITADMSAVYIAWPAATDLVYGATQSDGDLYGGKVMVYADGAYTDITSYGEFKWVTLATETTAGTYDYAVKFVEDTTETNALFTETAYRADLATATQTITQTVQPAAVTFTVDDTTLEEGETLGITITAENEKTLVKGEDYWLYYQIDGVWNLTDMNQSAPTAVGTYLVGASLTENYHHAGTLESTAKQIGAFTIYETGGEAPTTYSTTFQVGDTTYATYENAVPNTIHNLPTIAGEDYTGWLLDDTTYAFDGRYTQPAANVTFTAIAAPAKTCTIYGTVSGTDLDQTVGFISRVSVALYQGSTLIETTETDSNGEYSFTAVPGVYNVVVHWYTDTAYQMTEFVDVSADTANVRADFTLANIVQNVVLEVTKGLPNIVVDGLESLVDTTMDSEVVMQITPNVTADQPTIDSIVAHAVAHGIDQDDVKLFMNIDVSHNSIDVTDTVDLITFYIPLTGTFQGNEDYTVYRYHNGEIQTLTETANTLGEYIKISDDTTNLEVHARLYSLYGIAFANETIASSSTISTYSSTMADTVNGDASLSASKSTMNSKVTITTDPDDGYAVGSVSVTYASGKTVTVTDNGDGTYSYLQPGAAVTVTVTFVAIDGTEGESASSGDDWFFTDVDEGDWYYEAIQWAVDTGITTGKTTTTFDPYGITNRAQAVTFLWRSVGEPDYTADNEFTDVALGAYYYDSVLWAGEHDITLGTTTTTYSPYMDCSRAHIITFLWRLAGKPVVGGENPFTDVSTSNYYYDAVLWAVSEGITKGTTDTTFSPDNDCTRAQIVTFLYRGLEG